ncbi:amino acid ABC transporter substrate-binding protein (PAAT family) [Vagococcus fluvialis]|uniref:transporter substrate-binding domain-containing protein n=1 Tax=Vagococcus fluvialis TaxID=2738 RepID=UPI000DF3EF65|nr:transporter substrate-binding domain-containing protein [Vagococcus fluvialis]MBO0480625.1 transporter substrate-binding domain-containing protein [Vagococcus fluvialis]MBO0484145.1 transporter substrate-binding domain-containing protein [Vagococcus fluvialis]RCX13350.1 amino acid ABC transporter substrate-binding protein (PAAT family) [Vagococcus fluvialis]UDM71922.1 transporter substrate-binding domain-containing protein [Vagococcus fluvialis]UDM75278.1 transporter substrate-binding domai
MTLHTRYSIKKRVLLLVAALLFLLAGCGAKNLAKQDTLEKVETNQKIVWGVKYDTKLFGLMNIESRQVEGFDIDIAKALTKEILGEDCEAEFVEVTSKTRIPLLKNGNIDAIIATMTISEERKKQVDFSDVYFDAGQSLLVNKKSGIKGIEDLDATKTVLAVKGSTSAENIREHAPKTKVLELENYAEAFTALQSGQGDAMTTDNSILLGMAAENPQYILAGDKFTDEPYGIALNKGQEEFQSALNEGLEKIRENGEYRKIYKKWFNEEPK